MVSRIMAPKFPEPMNRQQEGFADVIKLGTLRWRYYPGLSGWAPYKPPESLKGKKLSSTGQREIQLWENCQRDTASPALEIEDGALGPGMQVTSRREAWQRKESSPRLSRKKHSSANICF